METSETERW